MCGSDQSKQYTYSDGHIEQIEGYSEKMKPFASPLYACSWMNICPAKRTCPVANEYERASTNQSVEENDIDDNRQHYGYTGQHHSPSHYYQSPSHYYQSPSHYYQSPSHYHYPYYNYPYYHYPYYHHPYYQHPFFPRYW